jgi:putative ABC transport system permease protein
MMGRLLLIGRLAWRDIRHHRAQALLLIIAVAAATATLTMALALDGVTSQPFSRTKAATRGPDAVAYMPSTSDAAQLLHAGGVVASSGPFPIVSAALKANGRSSDAFTEGRTEAPSAVDQPKVLDGSWVRPGGVVVERTFAQALNVTVGDHLSLNGHGFSVVGIAVTAAQPPYPNLCYLTANSCSFFQVFGTGSRNVGLVWTTESEARAVASKAAPLSDFALNVKLTSPSAANAFALRYTTVGGRRRHGPSAVTVVSTWQGIATADALLTQDAQAVLVAGSVLLGLLAVASVAVLVGRRLSEYTRRVGLLKAVGSTPALIALTFLAENVALALGAAAIGLLTGWLAAPLLTAPGAALIGAAAPPAVTATSAAEVIGVALVVALAATLVPAIRAARSSTVRALVDGARPPRRRRLLVRLSRRLPVPVLLGVRLVARRPRRALLTAANMAVTVAGLVAVVAFHATASSRISGEASAGLTAGGLSDPVVNRDLQMLGVVTIMLVTLALLNAVFATWATVRDARNATAVVRALGARDRQVDLGLVVTQLIGAIPGALAGVGLGLLLFKAAVKSNGTSPPVLRVVFVVLGALVAVALLTTVPARLGRRHAVAESLAEVPG